MEKKGNPNMELKQLTGRIWYYPYEQERDRPNLIYIRGDRWSLAVDAGHSDAHIAEFYSALEEAGFPLPQLTVLTHWHWDHTFAMHKVHGLTLASAATNRHLREIRDRVEKEGPESFLSLHESIRKEYAGNRPVIIVPSDLEFTGEMMLDCGNCPVRIFQTVSPHTDDAALIEVPGEKALFIGDANSGSFPDWQKDPALARQLAEAVETTRAEIILEGHWTPDTREGILRDILGEEG